MLSPAKPSTSRGEVWRVNLDPVLGAEMQKTRPAIVISSDAVGKLPLKLVVPVTGWDDRFAGHIWQVRVEPDKQNGLTKASAADVLQTRCVDAVRFADRMGRVSSAVMEEILAALVAVVEYE